MKAPTRLQQAEHRQACSGARILCYLDGQTYWVFRRDAELLARVMGRGTFLDSDNVEVLMFDREDIDRVTRAAVAAGHRVALLSAAEATVED